MGIWKQVVVLEVREESLVVVVAAVKGGGSHRKLGMMKRVCIGGREHDKNLEIKLLFKTVVILLYENELKIHLFILGGFGVSGWLLSCIIFLNLSVTIKGMFHL